MTIFSLSQDIRGQFYCDVALLDSQHVRVDFGPTMTKAAHRTRNPPYDMINSLDVDQQI
jgi:hypothetical protein